MGEEGRGRGEGMVKGMGGEESIEKWNGVGQGRAA